MQIVYLINQNSIVQCVHLVRPINLYVTSILFVFYYPIPFYHINKYVNFLKLVFKFIGTDVVQRLLAVPSENTLRELKNVGIEDYKLEKTEIEEINNINDTNNLSLISSDQIILFVRIEGENYSCLGRVAHISYNLQTQPIEFEWELLDFEKIKNHPTFLRILQT